MEQLFFRADGRTDENDKA